jgi:hypothetical protein
MITFSVIQILCSSCLSTQFVYFFLLCDVIISFTPLKRICPTLQPSGLLTYLDSEDKVPDSALEQEHLNTRDNLKIAQDHANRNRRGPHWITIERQIRVLEKHVEVWKLINLRIQVFRGVTHCHGGE